MFTGVYLIANPNIIVIGKNVIAIIMIGIDTSKIVIAIRKKSKTLLFSGVRKFIKNKISLFNHISSLAITFKSILKSL